MAITSTTLTGGISTVDSTSVVTSTFTPSSNALVLAALLTRQNTSTIPVPSISANGCTWVLLKSTVRGPSIGGAASRLSLFRTMSGAPVSGAATWTVAGTTQQLRWLWVFQSYDGVTLSTEGSDAVVQVQSTASTGSSALSVSLNPLGATGNAVMGVFGAATTLALTTGAGMTAQFSTRGTVEPGSLLLEDAITSPTTVVTASAGTTIPANADFLGIAIEIKAFTTVVPTGRRTDLSLTGVGR